MRYWWTKLTLILFFSWAVIWNAHHEAGWVSFFFAILDTGYLAWAVADTYNFGDTVKKEQEDN
jgi:hypothetical protein